MRCTSRSSGTGSCIGASSCRRASLSGAGSAVIGFSDALATISQIEAGFLAVAADMDLPGRVLVLAPRNAGATVVSTG